MSPPSSRSQARRQRSLVISLTLVIVVAFGALAGTLAANWSPRLGLDLAGGLSVVYQAGPPGLPVRPRRDGDDPHQPGGRARRVGGHRRDPGQRDEIVVSGPGVKNAQQVLTAIGQTGQLYFRPTLCYAPPYIAPKSTGPTTTTTTPLPTELHIASTSSSRPTSVQRPRPGGVDVQRRRRHRRWRPTRPRTADNPTGHRPAARADTARRPTATCSGRPTLTGHDREEGRRRSRQQIGKWVVNMSL